MPDIKSELLKVREICDEIDKIKKKISGVDKDLIRTYIKYNERLSHCEDESFSLRSDLEDLESVDLRESTEYLIEEINEFLGDEG